MSYLLDTNTCIRYLNGRSENIRQHFLAISPEELLLCSIVKAELLFGARKSAHVERTLEKVTLFMSRFNSLPFDDPAAEAYGRIRSHLERRGVPIGPNDLLIAAIAISHGVSLVTHNTREFSRIEGLILEDWEASAPPVTPADNSCTPPSGL